MVFDSHSKVVGSCGQDGRRLAGIHWRWIGIRAVWCLAICVPFRTAASALAASPVFQDASHTRLLLPCVILVLLATLQLAFAVLEWS